MKMNKRENRKLFLLFVLALVIGIVAIWFMSHFFGELIRLVK